MMNQNVVTNQDQRELLPLTNDAVLKLFFTRKSNVEQLKQFIKANTHLTDVDLATVEIKNSTLTKAHVTDKDFTVDIRLTSSAGHRINLELQVQNHAGFIDRMVSYNARQFASQLKRGQGYTTLKESISIVVVNFRLFDDSDEFSEHILFRRENRKIFTRAQQLFIIDLTKLPLELTESSHKWGALFKARTTEEVERLMSESEEMKVAGEKLMELSSDDQAQELARAREESQWAWEYTLDATLAQGREEGREEGREAAAKVGLENNVPLETIKLMTGLSEDEILALKNELDFKEKEEQKV